MPKSIGSKRRTPSLRQLIWSTIAGISCHPKIKKPGIFNPAPNNNGEFEEIFIEKWRTFDGWELEDDRLTCSVYPKYSTKSSTTSTPSAQSATFQPYELSEKGTTLATYTLIVQLQLQDVAIGREPMTLPYYVAVSNSGDMITPHGFNFVADEDVDLSDRQKLREFNDRVDEYIINEPKRIERSNVEVEINPAEEILREYMDLMRTVLSDLRTILPWSVRSTQVTDYDFPTASWSSNEPNVYFHIAYLEWEVRVFVPTMPVDLNTMIPTIKGFEFNDANDHDNG